MKSTSKSSDLVFTGIDINEATKKLALERDKILNEFAKAYLADTGVLPSEIELVSTQVTDNKTIETVYYFRKKLIDNN